MPLCCIHLACGIAIPYVHRSRVRVVTMAGAAIAIDDAAAADTILSVKQRVFALNRKLFVRRQRLVYSAGPRGMDALADDETLGGAGVARDGTAELDVLVADLTAAEAEELGKQVRLLTHSRVVADCVMRYSS